MRWARTSSTVKSQDLRVEARKETQRLEFLSIPGGFRGLLEPGSKAPEQNPWAQVEPGCLGD